MIEYRFVVTSMICEVNVPGCPPDDESFFHFTLGQIWRKKTIVLFTVTAASSTTFLWQKKYYIASAVENNYFYHKYAM